MDQSGKQARAHTARAGVQPAMAFEARNFTRSRACRIASAPTSAIRPAGTAPGVLLYPAKLKLVPTLSGAFKFVSDIRRRDGFVE
ncbi:hypothetical protein LFL97_26070 [Burkholderia sp. JSH-S8]|nr:hypothetical protein LFL97_26070 [Burkholderia sp. JSH-S8]